MKKILLGFVIFSLAFSVKADEGMWILKELDEISQARMKELGFDFPIDQLYSEDKASLKDAVVIFGGGCTGVVVSQKGLIFTNHHCGYGDIQKLSSVEHDYLKDGYVSQTNEEELPAEGLQVQFFKETKDITSYITQTLTEEDTEEERNEKIAAQESTFITEYLSNQEDRDFLEVRIVPFYSQNKYYLVVYEVFKDVRLVFTPPSSVGKFGGETDNWMWPRHTGDFSVFRVYANKDNQPTNYSEDNVPYTPKYSVPVSIKGYKDSDYAMTIGYPGRTQRYIPSWGIQQMVESSHEPRIEVRGAKQDIWREAMNADDAIRIKYATKYAMSSNYWKNAMGMNEAITNMNVIAGKEEIESQFASWVSSKEARKQKYGNTLSLLQDAYTSSMDMVAISTYFNETFNNGIEIVRFVGIFNRISKYNSNVKTNMLRESLGGHYKDYELSLDKELMPTLLALYAERIPEEYLPSIYQTINKKFKGDYNKYTEWFYKNTQITNLEDAMDLIVSDNKKIEKDPAIELMKSLTEVSEKINQALKPISEDILKGNREFMAGLVEMNPDKAFSPDANFTQRMSYGSIGGYVPADAIYYNHFSTTDGVFAKYKEEDPEFHVQDYILDAIDDANFGKYADQDGTMHVNFLSNNDITGGNSGSPVFNNNAELLGLAFDGNWEALSGDIVFNQEVQRCINVDIRYVLYMIDIVMNCPRIIDELTIAE